MWPKRRRRRYRRHEEWVRLVLFAVVAAWLCIWLGLEAILVALWLVVVISGALHGLAILAVRPLRRASR
jgi:hypothetical protein